MVEFENFMEHKVEFMKREHPTNEWADWSLHPQDGKAIIFREIMTVLSNDREVNYACAAYYCQNSKLTEEDVDSLLFVNSGLFTYDGWDRDTEKFVIDLLCKGNVNVYEDLQEAIKEKKLNPIFLMKCREVCSKAVERKLKPVICRKNDIKSPLYQIEVIYKDLAKAIQIGKKTKSIKERIPMSIEALYESVKALEDAMNGFGDFEVYLSDKLAWEYLIQSPYLSKEYIERRKPLWKDMKGLNLLMSAQNVEANI